MLTVHGIYTCFCEGLSLFFGRSMSELVLKDAERGGHKPSCFVGHWFPVVAI